MKTIPNPGNTTPFLGVQWGVGCGVWGVGCGVWGVGCGVWGVGCGVWGVENSRQRRIGYYNPVRAGGLCLCSSDFNRLLKAVQHGCV
ncbi:hypothetical protein [Coleofasciculus sp. E2-BRE-01]|uniref:hypothetical protein n=1 Tax=Coleofasciculus sp. E2-BRE-01 TaxID=3069524 RepID=UPI0032F4FC00